MLCAEVPLEAQKAERLGIIATKDGDFLLAIRYFNEARAIAPDDPDIFYSLGRLESQINGRELRAICLFEAFLAANGVAQQAGKAKSEIEEIDVKSQINLSKLIALAKRTAASMPSDVLKSDAQAEVAIAQGKAGDIEGALETAALIDSDSDKDNAWESIVSDQIGSGNLAGALKTAALIDKGDANPYGLAHVSIAEAQAKSGKIADALKTLEQVESQKFLGSESYKSIVVKDIAVIQARAGDVTGAKNTADLERKEIGEVSWAETQVAIAEAQADAGDIDGALKTAGMIDDDTESTIIRLPEDDYKHIQTEASVYIASALELTVNDKIKTGDLAGALKTADLIPKEGVDHYNNAHISVAVAQEESGKFDDALETIVRIDNDLIGDAAMRTGLADVARIQAKTGDIDGAERAGDVAKQLIEMPDALDDVQAAIATGQAEAGDFAGALKTVGFIGTDSYGEYVKPKVLMDIARHQAMAGDVAGAVKTTATAPDDSLKLTAEEAAALAKSSSPGDAPASASGTAVLAADPAKNSSPGDRAKVGETAPQARWLELLDGKLNTSVFMNVAEQLESQQSENSQKAFDGLMNVVREKVEAQNVVDQMLKQGH